jgi:thiol-disulfide isomerase/thioredoxin
VLLALLAAACEKAEKPAESPRVEEPAGREAPPLVPGGMWVQGGPITLESLRGKAVLLEFGFAGCKRCAAVVPHLVRWSREHGERVQAIFVNDGTASPRLEVLQSFVKDLGVTFPVVHEEGGESAKAYEVTAFPRLVLIDRRGRIAWEGSPIGREAEVSETLSKVVE